MNMKNFSECCFKITVPKLTIDKDNVALLKFDFVYTVDVEETVLNHVDFVSSSESRLNCDEYFATNMNRHNVSERFEYKDIYNLKSVKLCFVQKEKEYEVEYSAKLGKLSLNCISEMKPRLAASEIERKFYNGRLKGLLETTADSALKDYSEKDNYEYEENAEGSWKTGVASIDRQIKSLYSEVNFLKNGKGRKYKVTNGKLIGNLGIGFVYSFDLETELHLAESSPIVFTEKGNESKIAGEVLMCEDFQLILILEMNIGENIQNGHIAAEPWKIIAAMIDKTRLAIQSKSMITKALVKEGPKLSTTQPITDIAKGQQRAIELVNKNPVTLVWGPPGTGKTYTMAKIAIKALKGMKTVLVVSHSNVSVDGIASKIASLLREEGNDSYLKEGKVLRFGYIRDEELSKDEQVSSFLFTCKKFRKESERLNELNAELERTKKKYGLNNPKIIEINSAIKKIKTTLKREEKSYVSEAKIVATTISKVLMDSVFHEKKYDLVMFDEVSMAYVAQIVAASYFAKKRFICVGDFMQLSPIAQSEGANVLKEDIFNYLGIEKNGKVCYHPWLVLLDEQRRMYPDISAFSNKYVYNKLLRDHESVYANNIKTVKAKPFTNKAVNLIDLEGTYCAADRNDEHSRFNILSAFITLATALKSEKNVDNVSIITPYAAQMQLIRAIIKDLDDGSINLRCATVHQFQGSESDVVVFDAVESYPGKKPGWLMDKDMFAVRRLINVAITRARGKFITVANKKFWYDNYEENTKSHPVYQLLDYTENNGNVIKAGNLKKLINELTYKSDLLFYTSDYINMLCYDLESAKERIVISIPDGNIEEEVRERFVSSIKIAKDRGTVVLMKSLDCEELGVELCKYTRSSENAIFPLIIIDDQKIWYGAPFAKYRFYNGSKTYNTVNHVAVRFVGKFTAEILKSLTALETIESKEGKGVLKEKDGFKKPGEEDNSLGLYTYVKKYCKCNFCHKPMELKTGRSGKPYLYCAECNTNQFLEKKHVNEYIKMNNIRCREHNCEVACRISKYGLFISCEAGHTIKVMDI